jgi:ribosomal protein L11 methyltransferase
MAMMFEVRIRCMINESGKADLIRLMLVNIGVPVGHIVEQVQHGTTVVSFFETSLSRAKERAQSLKALKLKNIRVTISKKQPQDWTTRWKKYFKPFNINRDIRIVPLWMKKAKIPTNSSAVYLDTTFAFGSGLHATTQMMAKFMHAKKRHMGTFLDIGTGSGILSLIARAYGAKDVWAIDNDPVSVKTAQNNCRINNCSFEYLKAVKFEDFKPGRRFDFVAANLLTEDLIRMRRKLSAVVAPGGYLAVSGIFQQNYRFFRKNFESRALTCVAVFRKKNWYAVLFYSNIRHYGSGNFSNSK